MIECLRTKSRALASRASIAIALAALCACAPPTFVRPNTTMAEFDADISRCQYEATSSTATYGSGQNTARTLGGAIGQGIGIGLGRAIETNNLVALCMRARGYAIGGPSAGGYPALATTNEPGYPRPMSDPTGAVPSAYKAPAPRVESAPMVAASINAESKWMIAAEGVAKASGCSPPSAAMTSKGAGMEMFAVACPNGTTLAIRCEFDGCRVLR